MKKHNLQTGSVNPLLISNIIVAVLAAGFAGGFVWAYSNYTDQRDNVTNKVESAVTEAKKTQAAADEQDYLKREKEPYSQLIGPDDLGRVTISYPKTWSVYVAKIDSEGYDAYLHPKVVPTITGTQPFATRISVTSQKYDSVVGGFDGLVKRGDLKSAPVTVNSFNGVRLDGKFSATRTGSMVIFKVRDKTLTIASDAEAFRDDFSNIVVKSLDFNP